MGQGAGEFCEEWCDVGAKASVGFEHNGCDCVWVVFTSFVVFANGGIYAGDDNGTATRQGTWIYGGGHHDVEVDWLGGGEECHVGPVVSGFADVVWVGSVGRWLEGG